MAEHTKRIGVAVGVAVVLAIGVSIIAISSFQGKSQGQAMRTQTYVTDPKDNLQLRLYLNASSTSTSGVVVSVFVDEYNPLVTAVNVSAGNQWVIILNENNGAPCWSDGSTVGFAIAEGYYTSSNVTAAKFLNLVNPGATYNCPLFLGYGSPRGFLFKPMGDTAASYGCIGATQCPMGSASTGLSTSLWGPVTGFWNQGGTFAGFPRGAYTVVAEDEWGNSIVAHFTID